MCKAAGDKNIPHTTRAELGLCELLWAISSFLRCYFGRGERDLSFTINISAPISEELPCASIFTLGPLQTHSGGLGPRHCFSTLCSLSPFPRRKTLEGLVPPQSCCSEPDVSEMGVRKGLTCLGSQHSTGRFQNPNPV